MLLSSENIRTTSFSFTTLERTTRYQEEQKITNDGLDIYINIMGE
jgi:hypothetical protein